MPQPDRCPGWSEVLPRAKQLLVTVRDAAPKQPLEISIAHFYILGMYWRTVRLYEAVLLLLEAQLPEEAAIIARSLFEDSLRLRQLACESDTRDACVVGWAEKSISEKVGLVKEAVSLGLEPDAQRALVALDAERSKLQGYARRHGVARRRPFLSVRSAALSFGRKDDYWTYCWSHEAVHGSDACWIFARRKVTPDTVGLFGKTADPEVLIRLAAFAAVSVADATESASSIFSWKPVAAISDLSGEIERAAQAYAGQRP